MNHRLVILVTLAALGCAHRTRIETAPPGAAVYVGGAFACTTPCVYETPATKLEDHTPLRIERPAYATVDTELKTGILPSRIVGGFFTVGLVPLFKWPRTYHAFHHFDLRPLTLDERLADLDRRNAVKELSDQEHERLRRQLMGR